MQKLKLKHILIIILLLIAAVPLFAEKPMVGITGFNGNSPRSGMLTGILEDHINNIMDTSGIFDIVNPKLLKDELRKYLCLDEKCIGRFARDAGISLVISGSIDDMGDRLLVTIKSYGYEIPYSGKLIYSYRNMIPVTENIAPGEFSYIFEEHAGRFISNMLKVYMKPAYVKKSGDKIIIDGEKEAAGRYPYFRYESEEAFKNRKKTASGGYGKTGDVLIEGGEAVKEKVPSEIKENDFIFVRYLSYSRFLENYYYGRKKEIVLSDTGVTETLYKVLFTVPASASMPFAAPFLGYYTNSDWSGLILWTVNAAPYLYLEYYGLRYNYTDMKDKRQDVQGEKIARTRFAYYMFFTGGTSLFVDAFSHQYLSEASGYQGKLPLLGSGLSAGYLSLVSGGGGLFYRGYRAYGYLYFHLNNILLYMALREFSPGERYDPAAGKYEKGRVDKTRAYRLAGLYGLLKVTEITHAVLAKDRVWNGEVIDEEHEIEPVAYFDEDKKLNLGARYVFRF